MPNASVWPDPTSAPQLPLRHNIDLPWTPGECYRLLAAPAKQLPDFLILGAARSGTTSLFAYLTALPWIGGPFYKELHFFTYRWQRGVRFYRSRFPLLPRKRAAAARRGTSYLLGEASPSYLFYPYVAERAARLLPRAKLIVLLRNPIDRAHSAWRHAVGFGGEDLSFEDALAQEEARLAAGGYPADQAHERELLFSAAHHTYVRQGLYAEQLERWLAVYPREQIHVLGSEEFYAQPDRAMREVCEFIGSAFTPVGSYPALNSAPGPAEGAALAPDTRRHLAGLFRPHNKRLFALLGRRFDWDDGGRGSA